MRSRIFSVKSKEEGFKKYRSHEAERRLNKGLKRKLLVESVVRIGH